MKSLKKYLHLYRILVGQFLKAIMQSKADFFMGLIGFFLRQLTGVAFLYLIFEQIPSLKGWSLDEMIFIYGFAQIPRGIDHFFTDNLWILAWDLVVTGSFDRYMLRPMNLFFQLIAEKLQPDAIGELLVGIILVIRSISKAGIVVTVPRIILFLISIIAGAVIYTAIKLFCASFAFWLKVSGPIIYLAYSVSDFAKYPSKIYSKAVRFIITWVIPFGIVAYIPASYFLGKAGAGVIGVECLVATVMFAIAYATFKIGISRYESAGN